MNKEECDTYNDGDVIGEPPSLTVGGGSGNGDGGGSLINWPLQ